MVLQHLTTGFHATAMLELKSGLDADTVHNCRLCLCAVHMSKTICAGVSASSFGPQQSKPQLIGAH